MISDAELTLMQGGALIALRETGVIQRYVDVDPDSMGDVTRDWQDVATVRCAVAPSQFAPTENIVAGGVRAEARWTLTFPAGTDIREADRVVVLGETYEVVGDQGPRTEEILRTVLAKTQDR